MKKDAYWFKHDSTAGRGLRMRKMAHIYGHWGKGVYWDVIEILRDQSNYCFDSDDSSLQMLADLIGCKDEAKFLSWFRDCIRFELFLIQDNKFFSEVMCENMEVWETKKGNGGKGGRPKKTETITETITEPKPKRKPNRNHKIIEDKITEDKIIIKEDFLLTPLETALNNFYNFRVELKKPILDSSKEALRDKLIKLSNNDNEVAIEILNQSIANGWQGIFELKQQTNGTNNNKN